MQFKTGRPGKASLRKWHLSKKLKKAREWAMWICGRRAFQQRKQTANEDRGPEVPATFMEQQGSQWPV